MPQHKVRPLPTILIVVRSSSRVLVQDEGYFRHAKSRYLRSSHQPSMRTMTGLREKIQGCQQAGPAFPFQDGLDRLASVESNVSEGSSHGPCKMPPIVLYLALSRPVLCTTRTLVTDGWRHNHRGLFSLLIHADDRPNALG